MTTSRKLLVLGGLALAAIGMSYGLYYAVFVEHQTLDGMGGSLTQSFSAAASRDMTSSRAALQQYGEVKYDYVRQVDTHSHWVGLAMLMIVLGALYDRVNFNESTRQVVAISLLAGSAIFPLSVILQTFHHGALLYKGLAVVSSGLVIAALAATAVGFARRTESAS
jgi:hypothetical protein